MRLTSIRVGISIAIIAATAIIDRSRSCRLCNAADVNFDGTVDGSDLSIAASNYGERVRRWRDGDLTGDGRVTSGDLNQLLRLYGCSCADAGGRRT